jgi:hypothetical protein
MIVPSLYRLPYIAYPISYGCLLRRPGYIDRFSEVHLILNEANNGPALIMYCNIYRLIHGHFHICLVIIPRSPYWPETESKANMGRGMIARPIWKCPCNKLFITCFRHLEKRHPYWPETKSMPIWASIWKWSCNNLITDYFPGV